MLDLRQRFLNRAFARSAVIFLLVFSIIFTLFFWHLGSLTPGLSPEEKTAIESSASLDAISSDPVNGPHKLLQFVFTSRGESAILARLPSVILGLFFLACFYAIARRWFGRLIAVLSTLIFASLPWIVLTARSATPDIMFIGTTCLVATYIWLSVAQRKTAALLILSAAAALLAYTPGLVWFLITGFLLWRKKILTGVRPAGKWTLTAAALMFVIGILPLAAAAAFDISILQRLLLIPANLPEIIELLKSVTWGVLGFVWSTRDPYPLVLGNLPLLPAAVIVLTIFGIYIMSVRARIEFYGLLSLIMVAILAYGLNRNLGILTLAFPAIGILMAAGLRYLYAEWKSVFPLNPLPKILALSLMVGVVLLNMMFGIRYSLAAWPNAETTKNTYVLK